MKNTNVHKYTWYACVYKITKYVSINKTQHRPSIRYRQSMYYNRFLIFQLFQKKLFSIAKQLANFFGNWKWLAGEWIKIKDSNKIQSELFHSCFTFILKFAIRNIFWKAVESQVSQQINWRIVETYAFCR